MLVIPFETATTIVVNKNVIPIDMSALVFNYLDLPFNAYVQRRIMEGTKCVIAIAETPFGPGIIRPLATPR